MILSRSILLLVVSSCIPLIRAQELIGPSCCDSPICLQGTIQDIIAKLSVGIQSNNQELSINPLRYSGPFDYHINVSELNFIVVTTNNVFQGFADSKVSDAQLSDDGPNTVISFNTRTPHIKHTGDYTMDGVLKKLEGFDGQIPLRENGVATFTYNNTEFHHEIILDTEYRHEKPVLRVRSYRVKLQHAEAYTATFSNLFGGKDNVRSKAYSGYISKSLLNIVKQIMPEINGSYIKAFGKLVRELINGTPAEKLCPGRQRN
ncbi:unnamed protein product [Phaedon cochleariae]|uniref:Uncharacterized protein n=1 Tax=Phaedon cochleariae TaxID=80249 RepID=A0A9P0DNG4_PHACE|nr:unnamed protein product [Phaedon cochleariae]